MKYFGKAGAADQVHGPRRGWWCIWGRFPRCCFRGFVSAGSRRTEPASTAWWRFNERPSWPGICWTRPPWTGFVEPGIMICTCGGCTGCTESAMRAALNELQANMDLDRVDWTRPAGGYTIWLRLKNTRLSEKEIVDRLFKHGVAVLPGSNHFHGPADGPFFPAVHRPFGRTGHRRGNMPVGCRSERTGMTISPGSNKRSASMSRELRLVNFTLKNDFPQSVRGGGGLFIRRKRQAVLRRVRRGAGGQPGARRAGNHQGHGKAGRRSGLYLPVPLFQPGGRRTGRPILRPH